MLTRSCLSLLRSLRQPRSAGKPEDPVRSRGQVLVIFAVVLVALILFVGLAVDAGVMYLSYGQLKRAVDAAVVAAANDFKRGSNVNGMSESAKEVLKLHNVGIDSVDYNLYICDANNDGQRDTSLQTAAPDFYNKCPNTSLGEQQRKLVYIRATQHTPMYFLTLLGIHTLDLHTDAIAEAAPVDLVVVMDLSESMASDTITQICQPFVAAGQRCPIIDNYAPNHQNITQYDSTKPGGVGTGTTDGCNVSKSCHPLEEAKDAAKALVNTLYDGYDQVGIVTYASQAYALPIKRVSASASTYEMSNNMTEVIASINKIKLNDDPPLWRLMPNWFNPGRFNPVFPDDRDGDGSDVDNGTVLGYTCPAMNTEVSGVKILEDRWWSTQEGAPDPFGWGGVPCDDDSLLDAFDWNQDGIYTLVGNTDPLLQGKSEDQYTKQWMIDNDPNGDASTPPNATMATLSTCTGCGIRNASNILRRNARPGAVWVIVLLTDGFANMSDTNATNSDIPAAYKNGFCNGALNDGTNKSGAQFGYWSVFCIDSSFSPRYCIDKDHPSDATLKNGATCAPVLGSSTIWSGSLPFRYYSPMDYARDMADEAALTRSANPKEPRGNDIAIYTIGLGLAGQQFRGQYVGADLLRYVAAVGDDGDRTTDPCVGLQANVSCGQYYYAPTGDKLLPIFEDIASRIYTRINQ